MESCRVLLISYLTTFVYVPVRLSQLVHVKQTLAIINKQTLDAYNDSAADFIRATRLAGQVKQNLDDISRRLA